MSKKKFLRIIALSVVVFCQIGRPQSAISMDVEETLIMDEREEQVTPHKHTKKKRKRDEDLTDLINSEIDIPLCLQATLFRI